MRRRSSRLGKLTRRTFLQGSAALLGGCAVGARPTSSGVLVNDVHGQISATRVHRVVKPHSGGELASLIRSSRRPISLAGGRHSMGGQPFATDGLLIDTRGLDQVIQFDRDKGLIEVGAGMQWPAVIDATADSPWAIRQKQTGADNLCLGGAIASNIHSRGLTLKPFINDVEAIELVTATGSVVTCSREENADLFRLVIGGYGLFGAVASVTLRLQQRHRMRRDVLIADVENVIDLFNQRIADGYTYGDFQFATYPGDDAFLRQGVFACYKPVAMTTPATETPIRFDGRLWNELLRLAHTDKRKAFEMYTQFYQQTDGQVYDCDTQQLSLYVPDYHKALADVIGEQSNGSEVLTELYVPRDALASLLDDVRADCREHHVNVIYGTIRLIEQDDESYLAWANKPWACIIFNLHVQHHAAGIAKGKADFQRLIDRAIEHGGNYYLTYHRWARQDQVATCYPQMASFLQLKRKHDPHLRFQSDWYRHMRGLFEA